MYRKLKNYSKPSRHQAYYFAKGPSSFIVLFGCQLSLSFFFINKTPPDTTEYFILWLIMYEFARWRTHANTNVNYAL